MKKVAFLTGATGQDGYYLSNLLLEKGYEVYGMFRRTAGDLNMRVKHLDKRVKLLEGDITDMGSLIKIIQDIRPTEIYNLSAQSHVPSSFTQPISTCQITGMGVLNILEAIRLTDKRIKFCQASTSEMIGQKQNSPEVDKILFRPRSPYACAKVFGHLITQNYRESYGMFACSILGHNHESPLRPKQFVTRKITNVVSKIKLGKPNVLELGNLEAKRDWGHAKDTCEAIYLMLQQDEPKDQVVATGEAHSVREFVEEAFKVVNMPIIWEGKGLDEVGLYKDKVVVRINPKFYRPAEVEFLLGDYSLAKKELGWEPKIKFKSLVRLMVENDLKIEGGKE